jgi:hypothetical protein
MSALRASGLVFDFRFYKDFAPLVLENTLKKGWFSQILSFAKFSR